MAQLSVGGNGSAVGPAFDEIVQVSGRPAAVEAAAVAAFFAGMTRVVDASGIASPLEGVYFEAAVSTAVGVSYLYRFRWFVLILVVVALLKYFGFF